jgi:hypothetical protein
MASETFGQMLLNDALPGEMRLQGPVTKKVLSEALSEYARNDPQGYAKAIQKVKWVGDEVSTLEGISVGLADIAPDYARRDPIMKDALRQMKATNSDAAKRKILLDTQASILATVSHHPSDMTLMARSGGRGSMAQLMKTVASPVVSTSSKGEEVPWLITKSYSQGLSSADAWVTGAESRRNAIASTGSVVEPGAVAKVVVTNMENLVITIPDCRTTMGVLLPTGDQTLDRYLARTESGYAAGELVTPQVLSDLKKKGATRILVRSPSTCTADDGVCQKCMGLNEWGKPFQIGSNVGVRSAQALTEPLTQFALNAKHGVRMAGGRSRAPSGLTGFRTYTEIPKSFTDRAALSEMDGVVTSVAKAPQGGWNIKVGTKNYYIPPGLRPIVKERQKVEAGDALSDGTPMPDDVMRLKGVGAGRQYMADSLTSLYNRQGVDIDRRHSELLARSAMNYVKITSDPTNTFIRGDVVNFKDVQKAYKKDTTEVPLKDAKGKLLGDGILHFTVGTRVTDSVLKELKDAGIQSISVSKSAPKFDPLMKSIIQTPLLSDDWMSRLSHRYLRKTLVEGAGMGAMSDYASTSPSVAFAMGTPFGTGENGKYASEYDEIAEYEDALEKLAVLGKVLPMAKKVLFGGGEKALTGLKHISTSGLSTGGIENSAHLARRMSKNMGGLNLEAAGMTRGGEITNEGINVMNKVQGMRSPKGWMGTLSGSKAGPSYSAEGLDEILPGVSKHITPQHFQKWDDKNTLGWRTGKTLQDMAFGASPLQAMKQRYQHGGMVGKGGVLTGDFAIDPDTIRTLKNFRTKSPQRAANGKLYNMRNASGVDVATALGSEAMNKTFTIGAPAAGLYAAATNPVGEGESRMGNIGRGLGDVVGFSAMSPLGYVGGVYGATPFGTAGQMLGEKMDKNYVPPANALAPHERLQQQARRNVASLKPVYYLNQGREVAQRAHTAYAQPQMQGPPPNYNMYQNYYSQ